MDSVGDLGVRFYFKLFSGHVNEKISKAYGVLSVIKRNFFLYMDKNTFSKLYKAIIKLHLEYANAVKKGYIERIEKVQKRAATMWPLSHHHSSS